MRLTLVTALSVSFLSQFSIQAAPIIDPIGNVSVPAGKSITLPITANSPEGRSLSFAAFSSTNRITVEVHSNNPFWKLSVVQVAANNAPGAYQTPFRGTIATVTNMGELTFLLFRDRAQRSVDALLGLTASGFYNSNTIFQGVQANNFIQGGDPQTNGLGGSAVRLDQELHPRALFRGSGQLGMVAADKDWVGSQFLVTLSPQPGFELLHTFIGQLVRGSNVLSRIGNVATNGSGRPLADVIITRASEVPNTTDTAITLTGTNLAGVAGTIRVIADDGAGGRTTNSFTATTVSDIIDDFAILKSPPITNRFVAVNGRLTNVISGLDLEGGTLYYDAFRVDPASGANSSNSVFTTTYTNGVFVIVPNQGYAGPLRYYVAVSDVPIPFFQFFYDYQEFNVAVGDTPIWATNTSWAALPGVPFSNQLLAVFSNGVPSSPVGNFTAFINWGDNSTNSGTIVAGAGGLKEVRGSHTYTNSGNYPVYVTLQSVLGADATTISTAVVRPRLNIIRSGSGNVLSWPAAATDYQLQTHTNLATTNWTAVTNFPSLVGYERVVTNSSGASNLFFRLRR
jgi:cyclophilin family peptidyl-prolyl cis-trans isomerase